MLYCVMSYHEVKYLCFVFGLNDHYTFTTAVNTRSACPANHLVVATLGEKIGSNIRSTQYYSIGKSDINISALTSNKYCAVQNFNMIQ